ncbi:hypothetical protein [Agreia sp. Leaf210]|uniref:hypothetical protein n=1 Tax=Agreia sp. Leaf210 TaxID=1735682 RepID=UPI0006F93225|nr:hypothetical protein [Agreia sp. Leaf210]KQM60861.1 hypothetical protein ASE64_04280 [Agreia sp. Leaf210]
MTDIRSRAWLWGGIALIASAIIQFALPSFARGQGVISALLVAAALMLFAFGGGVRRNIFGGHVLGAVTAMLLAALTIVTSVVNLLPESGGSAWNQAWVASVVGFARLALGFILVVQIARSPLFSSLWRWGPLWAVLAQAAGWVVFQFGLINAGNSVNGPALWATSLFSVVAASVPIFIGVLAIIAAVTSPSASRSTPS